MEETTDVEAREALPPVEGAEWNPVERVILERRSVRLYKDKQVPEAMVRRILEAGRFAPSAGNCQPWKFIVIRDREMLESLERYITLRCKLLKFFLDYRTSPLGRPLSRFLSQVMIRIKRNQLHPIPFGAILLIAEGKLKVFHGAQTVILILEDSRGVGEPAIDIGCAGENMVLAAHSMGLGTCWIGMVEWLKYGIKWRRRLGVRFPYRFSEAIVLGYPFANPDGMIAREEMGVDWYEDGAMRTVTQGGDDV